MLSLPLSAYTDEKIVSDWMQENITSLKQLKDLWTKPNGGYCGNPYSSETYCGYPSQALKEWLAFYNYPPEKADAVCQLAGSYDWQQAFQYADKPDTEPPGSDKTSGDYFTILDVEKIIAMEDGDNDGPNWVGVFKLDDGRVAYLSAGCDYTGWD